MPDNLKVDFIQVSTTTAMAVIGAVFGIQKMLKSWKETSAETDVITIMHKELSRLGEYNKTLSEELGSLQKKLIDLNRELRSLADENQRLHTEVSSLTGEITRLKDSLRN